MNGAGLAFGLGNVAIEPDTQVVRLQVEGRFCAPDSFKGVWGYVSKIVLVARNSLNVAVRNTTCVVVMGPRLVGRVKDVTVYCKLVAIVGVPFTLQDIQNAANKVYQSALRNDLEGVVMGLLSLIIVSADAVDGVATFTNAARFTASLPPLEVFSALGMPLSFTMAGLGCISRTIQIAKTRLFYNELQVALQTELSLQSFLQSKLSYLKESSMQGEQAKAALLRSLPANVADELSSLLTLLESKLGQENLSAHKEVVDSKLQWIQDELVKKMQLDGLAIMASCMSLTALTLLQLGSAGAAPFALFATASLVRIAASLYQDYQVKLVTIPLLPNQEVQV